MRGDLTRKYARPLTPSNEGFTDGLKKLFGIRSKDDKTPVEQLDPLDWMSKNLRNGQLGSHLKTVSGPVTIPQSAAGYFTRGGKQLRTGMDEYESDLQGLGFIHKRMLPILEKYMAVAAQVEKAVDGIKSDATPEDVNKILEAFVGKFPQSPAEALDPKWGTDPWGWVGGYREQSLVVKRDGALAWNTNYEKPQSSSLAVSFSNAQDVAEAIKWLTHLVQFQLDLDDLDDKWMIGLDATDPPLRRFAQDDSLSAKAWEGFTPAGHDDLWEKASSYTLCMQRRSQRLIEGLVIYLKAATTAA